MKFLSLTIKVLSQIIVCFKNIIKTDFDKFTRTQGLFNTSVPSELTCAKGQNLIDLYCDNSIKAKLGSRESSEFLI